MPAGIGHAQAIAYSIVGVRGYATGGIADSDFPIDGIKRVVGRMTVGIGGARAVVNRVIVLRSDLAGGIGNLSQVILCVV